MASFQIFQQKKWQIEHSESSFGSSRTSPKKYSDRKEWPIRLNTSNKLYKTMMVSTKEKLVMERNTGRVNIISKTATFMRDKCLKEWCRAAVNTPGPIKTFTRALFCKTKWQEMVS